MEKIRAGAALVNAPIINVFLAGVERDGVCDSRFELRDAGRQETRFKLSHSDSDSDLAEELLVGFEEGAPRLNAGVCV